MIHISPVQRIIPRRFGDARGWFTEVYSEPAFAKLGIECRFVQDNHSRSAKGVLRGLHYQVKQPQGKLVRVISGEVFDVAVDLRRRSPTFGQWVGIHLSAENKKQLWIPEGFAHGFVVLSEVAEFVYKTTDYWAPEHERSLAWNDPTVAIDWPLDRAPSLSGKDQQAVSLTAADVFE